MSGPADPAASEHDAARRRARLRYLHTTDDWHSWYPLFGIDRAMAEVGLVAVENPQGPIGRRLARLVSGLGLGRNLRRGPEGPVFVAMMGFSEGRTLPIAYGSEIVPYAFDCWPHAYERWMSFFRRQRIRLAFFSSRQSAEHFQRELPAMRSVWLPEAVDPDMYQHRKRLLDRDIDVLELGRKHDRFHGEIAPGLAASGRVHLFERKPRAKIFPSRRALSDGLAACRISVCFPRSMTHPVDTGGVETVTHRYFESIASGCIVLGHCPAELCDLFGYNPVVEVEWGNEVDQIDRILTDPTSFQDLVDANYRRLLEVGTWRHRVPTVLKHVQELGLT